MSKATEAMRTATEVIGIDKHLGLRTSSSVKEQKEIVARIERENGSKMHIVAKYAASIGAGIAVEYNVMSATFAFGNGVSQALTGENLHGVGLAATAATATVLGVGTGIRTAFVVQDGIDMVDEWRLEKANHCLQVLEDVESRAGTSEEEDDAE